MRKHPKTYDKALGSFISSILKWSNTGSDILFFAKIIDNNTSAYEVKYINKAVYQLKGKIVTFNKRVHSFKSLKLNIQEIMKLLSKIFNKKIERNMNGKSIQTRIRDYFSHQYTTLLTETNGQGFLHIVRKEAENQLKYDEYSLFYINL